MFRSSQFNLNLPNGIHQFWSVLDFPSPSFDSYYFEIRLYLVQPP